MAHDVFISYSAEDKATANAVCASLEGRRLRCWIAPRDIAPGEDWSQSIMNALASSRVLVLVLTRNANNSPQVRHEIERAVNKGLVIVPVRVEDFQPCESLMYFLGAVHWLDALTPPLAAHLKRLAESVAGFLDKPIDNAPPAGTAQAAPSETDRRHEHRSNGKARERTPPPGPTTGVDDGVSPDAPPTVASTTRPPNRLWMRLGAIAAVIVTVLIGIRLWPAPPPPQIETSDSPREPVSNVDPSAATLARAYDALIAGKLDESESLARQVLASGNLQQTAYALLANALCEQFWLTRDDPAKLEEARRQLAAAEQLGPPDAQTLTARGNLLIDEQPKRAVEALREAVKADDASAYSHHQLGFALGQDNRHDEALLEYKRALELAPNMDWVQANLGWTLLQLNKPGEAIPHLVKARDEDLSAPHRRYLLGSALLNTGDLGGAQREFTEAVRLTPDLNLDAGRLYRAELAGAVYKLTGDRDRAWKIVKPAWQKGLRGHWVLREIGVE